MSDFEAIPKSERLYIPDAQTLAEHRALREKYDAEHERGAFQRTA